MLSRHTRHLPAIFSVLALFGCFACSEQKAPSPGDTVLKLLDLHNLAGKLPGERTKENREVEVDRAKLAALIVDLDEHDPFIADIYVGFVLGVFRFSDMIEVALRNFASADALEIYLYDAAASPEERLIYFQPSPLRRGNAAPLPEDEVYEGLYSSSAYNAETAFFKVIYRI